MTKQLWAHLQLGNQKLNHFTWVQFSTICLQTFILHTLSLQKWVCPIFGEPDEVKNIKEFYKYQELCINPDSGPGKSWNLCICSNTSHGTQGMLFKCIYSTPNAVEKGNLLGQAAGCPNYLRLTSWKSSYTLSHSIQQSSFLSFPSRGTVNNLNLKCLNVPKAVPHTSHSADTTVLLDEKKVWTSNMQLNI